MISRRTRVWLGLWGGAVAWLVHFLSLYALAEFGCVSGFAGRRLLGVSLVAWAVLAITAAALAVTGAATRASWRLDRGESSSPEEFAGHLGWTAGGLFALVIVVETIPVFFYLRDCASAVLR